jgi:hypothetical protein
MNLRAHRGKLGTAPVKCVPETRHKYVYKVSKI